MKLLILSLLVLTSLCFVLGDDEDIQPNFADGTDDGEMLDDAPDDYVADDEDNVSPCRYIMNLFSELLARSVR